MSRRPHNGEKEGRKIQTEAGAGAEAEARAEQTAGYTGLSQEYSIPREHGQDHEDEVTPMRNAGQTAALCTEGSSTQCSLVVLRLVQAPRGYGAFGAQDELW